MTTLKLRKEMFPMIYCGIKTSTSTWAISPRPPRKSKKPNDDFPEENAKLDSFLKTFAKE